MCQTPVPAVGVDWVLLVVVAVAAASVAEGKAEQVPGKLEFWSEPVQLGPSQAVQEQGQLGPGL